MDDTFANAAKPRDRPWVFRTYSGHSSAAQSNALFRTNLERGQTGLSIAFDLPTQTGYDSDHPLARGEVGKVGVPVRHLGDMQTLLEGIPLERMNTSMTINAPAAWLLALYIATAERRGIARKDLSGTVQNDIIKEYLSRGTYIFPPGPSLGLIADMVEFCIGELPKWNPINVCSYHLQEAGATPVQEVAFSLATALAVLDTVRARGRIDKANFPKVVGRISFFVNAGIRFIGEVCKMRAFCELWDGITADRYGVEDPKMRRFRYGVQVNSLGLSEQQPENNVYRITLEMLGVVLSKDARARAVQLPAWNEALGLPRPWDQQWSLRLQQIMAYESDLLEYGDIFAGSRVIEQKVEEIKTASMAELERILDMGGAVAAVENSYMKQRLVEANARRLAAIESGQQVVVGVNRFCEGEASPLLSGKTTFLSVDSDVEAREIAALIAWRKARDEEQAQRCLGDLAQALKNGDNVMEPSIACAHAGVTTGEWSAALRAVFGEYRASTGISAATAGAASGDSWDALRAHVRDLERQYGVRPKLLIGKPGLDGHSNGAEQIAMRARDAGFEVIYEGIRLSAEDIAHAALQEGVHVVGLSILSGSHASLVRSVRERLSELGLDDVALVVGGIIPDEDARDLLEHGVAGVYTPKNFDLNVIIGDLAKLAGEHLARIKNANAHK